MPNPRPCIRCDKTFQPTGKHCRVCDDCCKRAYASHRKKKNINSDNLKN